MADDINKKISIDVQVNTDAQQQIDQYKASFDNLRTSIGNLGKPLSNLSTNLISLDRDISKLSGTLDTLNAKNQTLAASSEKSKSKIGELVSSFSEWKGMIEGLSKSLGGWGIAISAALAILSTYADTIVDWIQDMINGTTTLTALGKALKDNKIIMDALNKTRSEGDANAQQELVHLKLLYAAAQDHNVSLRERKKIIGELRELYPAYFKNISDEAIMNGKATKSYKELAASIIAAARARAAEDMIVKNSQRQLGNDNNIEKLTKQLEEYQAQLKNINDVYQRKDKPGRSFDGIDIQKAKYQADIEEAKKKVDGIQKLIADIHTDSKLLNGQNNVLAESVLKTVEKQGAKIFQITQKTHDQQKQITAKSITETEKQRLEAHAKELQEKNKAYADDALAANQHYTDEKDELDESLNNKLITQAEYYEKSQKLESDYHISMGEILKKIKGDTGGQTQLPKLSAHGLGIPAPEPPKDIIITAVKDETEKQTAITEAAKKAAEERARLELEAAKKAALERANFELDTSKKVSDAAFSIISKSIQAKSDAKIKGLENDKARELSNGSLTSAQKLAIEAKYKKQEGAIKAKAFKDEQKLSIVQALINGAVAITKAEAQMGPLGTFVIPVIIAETAIQVATIASQKAPAFAKGGHFQSDGKGAVLPGYSRTDNTNAHLRSSEAVVVSEAMRDPWARNLVSAINVAYGGRDFSVPNVNRGYAVGGIFTDGGNANRYYNQPVNDQKNLANTVAYQMINNFPPVYVDVKDVNNQQNILAQTVNRVNL